ncbi:MAG TPA: MarR family transcriptional regulator [Actinomycetes bacterium]|nr:MarR family transcriptional regulator [Actinomycetes bacterium]
MQATPQRDELATAVFALAGRLKRMQYDEPVERAGLAVLHTLACRAEPLRLSGVAAALSLDSSTVSRHVRSLEDAGLIGRTCDPDDRRAYRLTLTEQGAAALEQAFDLRACTIDAALADWSPADRAQLTTLLTRLEADLGRRPESAPRTLS